MRFISLNQLATQAREAAARFPLVLLSAGVSAGAAMALVSNSDNEAPTRILMAALLGLSLFTAVVTAGERANWSRTTRALVQAGVALLLIACWFLFGRWTESMRVTRLAHLAVVGHLAVAVLAFVGTTLHRAFWQFNRIIFVRYLTGALFAAVLFTGLAIALLAIDKLFGVRVDSDWYARLWIVIAFIFHPWYFLGGVPRDLNALEARDDYPAGLKVFAQFILIPVVTVYMLILTAYLVRVVITRTWPSGWIGYLVSSVAGAGTLALLLVHPARQRADSRWVDVYGRWFFVALLPSIGMLLIAIWLRIGQYGITERRYFLAVLALWLAGIALYYGLTGSRNIRIIPTTLGAVAVATLIGPWSAYAVSQTSQLGRLRDLLVRNGMLADTGLTRPPAPVAFEQRREMSAVFRYLIDTHGPRSLAPLSDALPILADRKPDERSARFRSDHPAAQAVMEQLGAAYVGRWQGPDAERVVYFTEMGANPIRLDGYEWMTRGDLAAPFSIAIGGDSVSFAPDSQPARVAVSRGGQRLFEVPLWPLLVTAREYERADSLRLDAAPLPARPDSTPAPASSVMPVARPPLLLEGEGGGLRVRFLVTNVAGTGDSSRARVTSASATILLRLVPR